MRALRTLAATARRSFVTRVELKYAPFEPAQQWLASLNVKALREDFNANGVLSVPSIINRDNVPVYARLYSQMLSGDIDSSKHRHDLGSYLEGPPDVERVCQIMWPSEYFNANQGPLHERAVLLAKALLGDDMEIDFDHLIYKAPGANHPFPWHQDEGYWRNGMKGYTFPDLRATSIWVALDDATIDNGCMWMVPGSHKLGYFEHAPIREGHHTVEALGCEDLKKKAKPFPIPAGGAVLNTGRTLHYTGGNVSNRERKAFIINCRPASMIEFERNLGFDHAKESGIQSFKEDVKKNLK